MTPTQLTTYIRQQYNATNDSFFSDAEIYRLIWAAQMEFAREAYAIEQVYTTSTVADQQEYDYPTNTMAIKRLTYAGQKLMPINFREDDAITLTNSATTATGTPQYYFVWKEVIYLRPIPSAVGTLKIYAYVEPSEVTSSTTIEVPTRYHLDLADFALWRMYLKDQNTNAAAIWQDIWNGRVEKAKIDRRRELRADSFAAVQNIDTLPETVIGAV